MLQIFKIFLLRILHVCLKTQYLLGVWKKATVIPKAGKDHEGWENRWSTSLFPLIGIQNYFLHGLDEKNILSDQ